jgi:hypothetical protein
MKKLSATALIFLLTGGLALAQGIGGATKPVGSGTTGPTNPDSGSILAPAPSERATLGQGAKTRSNAQDLTSQGNRKDLIKPGSSNLQDLNR